MLFYREAFTGGHAIQFIAPLEKAQRATCSDTSVYQLYFWKQYFCKTAKNKTKQKSVEHNTKLVLNINCQFFLRPMCSSRVEQAFAQVDTEERSYKVSGFFSFINLRCWLCLYTRLCDSIRWEYIWSICFQNEHTWTYPDQCPRTGNFQLRHHRFCAELLTSWQPRDSRDTHHV